MRNSWLISTCMFLMVLTSGAAFPEDIERAPALTAPLPAAAPSPGDKHLGFVMHWSMPGREDYVRSGSPSMLMNLFGWNMRDQSRQLVDFKTGEEWLRYLYETGLESTIIIDTSIHHTSTQWRSDITKALGENVYDQDGVQSVYSSPFSPKYREMVEQYIADITAWVVKNDTARKVTAYVDGAEVFWPGLLDYGPLAQAAFREWIQRKHGGLDQLNQRWGATYASWDDVKPLPFYRFGAVEFGPSTFHYGVWDDAAWVAPLPEFKQGMRIRAGVSVKAEGVLANGVEAQIIFLAKDHPLAAFTIGSAGDGDVRLERDITAPAWATEAQLHLQLHGAGQAIFSQPSVSDGWNGESILPNPLTGKMTGDAPEGWSRAVWHGDVQLEARDGGKSLALNAAAKAYPIEHPSAAWYDFATFSMESYAKVMNHWAQRIRANDPSRDVMHYLGFCLGTLSQWDDLTLTQRPDIFLANAQDVDILGIQLPIAKGDFHYATAPLDIARKYDKPMVATDFQDFTHGVYVGFNALNRGTLAAIAHGMDGSYYYDWRGTPGYDWHEAWPMEDTTRMLRNADRLINQLKGAKLVTHAALLLPIEPYCEADPGGQKGDMLEAMGWYKLLAAVSGVFDVVTPYELTLDGGKAALDGYSLVVAPDCPRIPAKAFTRLEEFAVKGGAVIFGGRVPSRDETGAPYASSAFANLPAPGESLAPPSFPGESMRVGVFTPVGAGKALRVEGAGRLWLGPVHRATYVGNTPPLYLPDEERGNYGWPRRGSEPLHALAVEWVKAAGATPSVSLAPADPRVEMAIHRRGDELIIVLINTVPGMHFDGKLALPKGADPATIKVEADFEARNITTETDAEGIRVPLPSFADCCTVTVSCPES